MPFGIFPFTAKAQYGFDVASIEAYINDHKQQRSLLLVRSTLEASNKLLHEYSSDANIGFRDINKELDRYTRAFDIIDILYQSLRTSLNIYNTYETSVTVWVIIKTCLKTSEGSVWTEETL